MREALIEVAYLLAAVLFILGLKGLAKQRTAVGANILGAAGMAIAVVATLLDRQILDYRLIFAGILTGAIAGAFLAVRVRMTAMPQMVALLNGFGGLASALVAGAVMVESVRARGAGLDLRISVAMAASGLIGAVTFWGSLVAFAKLQEIISDKPLRFRGQHSLNLSLAVLAAGLAGWMVAEPGLTPTYWALLVASSALGVLLILPIGGADMPVVISLLNSYSGLAACATGFLLSNSVLIIAGSLVGASGIILTRIMCRAMNRSLANVLFGGIGAAVVQARDPVDVYGDRLKSTTPEEVAALLDAARRVVIVPGYGMAVAQAQHAVQSLASLLECQGIEVEYGIHPVAGRMPGHMNVLLAEANVPYEKLKDIDEINLTFAQTDVAIVIGANDVVNPLARTDPKSPIAGMPILDVDRARTVVVIKRSLSPGFAGIPNPLFAGDNTLMLFGDGKQAIQDIIASLKAAMAA